MAESAVAESIQECIDNKSNFILDAGAGSGKTYTLVEALKYIINQHSREYKSTGQRIACITYTGSSELSVVGGI